MVDMFLGISHYYVFALFLTVLLVDEKLVNLSIAYNIIFNIDQFINPLILSQHPDKFFLLTGGVDATWFLCTLILMPYSKIRPWLLLTILISFAVNIYLVVDTEYNIVYQYWNNINFILLEIIIFLLLASSPYITRFNNWLHSVAIDMTYKYHKWRQQ